MSIAIDGLICCEYRLVGVMWLVYGVCTATASALTTLCPVLYLGALNAGRLGTHIDYTHACTCSGSLSSSDGSCSTGWSATQELTDTCDDLNTISSGATTFGFALMIVIAGMVGMLAVALRNRQRIGSLLDARQREIHAYRESMETEAESTKRAKRSEEVAVPEKGEDEEDVAPAEGEGASNFD